MGFRESLPQNVTALCGGCLCVRSTSLREAGGWPTECGERHDAAAILLCLRLGGKNFEIVADLATTFTTAAEAYEPQVSGDDLHLLRVREPQWFEKDPFWHPGLECREGSMRPVPGSYPPQALALEE